MEFWDFVWEYSNRSFHSVVLYKAERKCHLIDIAVPGDKRTELKEQEKVHNCSELRREGRKIWNLSQIVVFSVAIGTLGVTSKGLKD